METTDTGEIGTPAGDAGVAGGGRTSRATAAPAREGATRNRPRLRRRRRPRLRGARNVGDAERWLSVLGGGALAVWGMRRRGASGTLAALAGTMLVERGVTGHCPVYDSLGVDTAGAGHELVRQHGPNAVLDASRSVRVEHAVTVDRPREELYRYWRDLENLPRVMRHLESVQIIDDRHSHWVARAPGGRTVEWDAEIHNEVPGEIIAWKSLEGASVPNAGSVHFADAPGGGGTEVRVILEYIPPAGRLGAAAARLLDEEPDTQVREDLERFKQEMERGAKA
ncbi:MAG TPA: SRPBCC family protein [Gemmatimonadaceae bacterium]|nr:SRPBCC family protein [Gemmatimonadaceae bacterium]